MPTGALGLGWEAGALEAGLAAGPDLIAVDGGSTDSGPSYLGRGVSKYARAAVKAEWTELLDAQRRAGVPLVLGTAGTCGADAAVDWMLNITRECLAEAGRPARIAVLKCGQPPEAVRAAWEAGRVTALPGAPHIDAETIESCTNVVALAGAEQIEAALRTGAEVVIAGRTTDTAIIAALPLMNGDAAGAAWHGSKIAECGALCATRPQSGVLMLETDATGFTVTPMAEGARATPRTVLAHMLYENTDPHVLFEPGGHLDARAATYEAASDRSVRVEGSVWVPGPYTVKLEGARIAGYQTILLSLLRDRRYVENAAEWCEKVEAKTRASVARSLGDVEYDLELRRIGMDAALGAMETRAGDPSEVGVLGIVTAPTQETATQIAMLLNPPMLHHPLTDEEEQPTFAFAFSPPEIERGPLWEFALHHVMALDDPMEAFRLEVVDA